MALKIPLRSFFSVTIYRLGRSYTGGTPLTVSRKSLEPVLFQDAGVPCVPFVPFSARRWNGLNRFPRMGSRSPGISARPAGGERGRGVAGAGVAVGALKGAQTERLAPSRRRWPRLPAPRDGCSFASPGNERPRYQSISTPTAGAAWWNAYVHGRWVLGPFWLSTCCSIDCLWILLPIISMDG